MRYIRTKDNQFITLCANEKEWATLPKSQTGGLSYKEWFNLITKNDDILKQADKIEDLCDEFILFDKEYPHDFYIDHYYEDILEVYEQEKRTRDLYGAIWTDWGLKYVAKINENREWELL